MITTRTTLVVALSLFAGCQRSSSTEPQVVSDAKESRTGVASADPAAPGPKATTPADAPVMLTPNADGTIRLQYTDRWGASFDATYESAEFLRRALPTLKRSLSEPRFTELEQASERLERGSVR